MARTPPEHCFARQTKLVNPFPLLVPGARCYHLEDEGRDEDQESEGGNDRVDEDLSNHPKQEKGNPRWGERALSEARLSAHTNTPQYSYRLTTIGRTMVAEMASMVSGCLTRLCEAARPPLAVQIRSCYEEITCVVSQNRYKLYRIGGKSVPQNPVQIPFKSSMHEALVQK